MYLLIHAVACSCMSYIQTDINAVPCDINVRFDPITHSSIWGFHGARLRVPGAARNGDMTTVGMKSYFTDVSGLQPVGGKVHFHVQPSDEYQFKCSRRVVEPPFFEKSRLEKTTDLIKPAFTPVTYGIRRRPEKRHCSPITHVPITSEGRGISQKYHVMMDDPLSWRSSDGLMRCQERRSGPFYVEDEMQMKQRVGFGDLMTHRNNIGLKSEGDKSYRFPDYCGDFFQKGELAEGSSFVRGHFEKTMRRNESCIDNFIPEQPRKSIRFADAQKARTMKELEDQVKGLIDWEVSRLTVVDGRYVEPSDSEDEGYRTRQATRLMQNQQEEESAKKPSKKK